MALMRKDYWKSVSTPLTVGILLAAVGCLASLVLWRNCSQSHDEQVFARKYAAIKRGESSELDLHYTHGTDGFLSKIGCLPALTSVCLDRTDVTNAGIKELSKSPRLTTLIIRGGRIDDKVIDYLSSVKGLEELELSYTLVSDEGIRNLNRLLHLRVITIGYARSTDRASPLTDNALKYLGQLQHVKRIQLNGHWFTFEALADLRRKLAATVISSDSEETTPLPPPSK
jgi:hypothetical protein